MVREPIKCSLIEINELGIEYKQRIYKEYLGIEPPDSGSSRSAEVTYIKQKFMAYKLLGADGKEINLHDLQDKGPWCTTGASFEEVFVEKYGKELSLIINPAKKNDPFAPDLINVRYHQ